MDRNPFAEIVALFNKLSLIQRVLIGGAVGLTIVLLGILFTFLNEPAYSTLFTNLDEKDASEVLDHLNGQSIPYKLEDKGRTVKVPGGVVYETRLALSAKGVPNSGIVGYEIFDQNTMGMSKFLQHLNYKRALEGELSRTIMQVDGVEGVRVHIVTPEQSIFKDEQKPTTASVILNLRSASNLSGRNIQSIVNLVSGSVEGLETENITIIDSKGRLLSGEKDKNDLAVSSSRQYEITQKIENYLANKAQSILDNVLGYGNAIIKVNAELNFGQVEKTIQSFDPESQVAISEQVVKSETSDNNTEVSNANNKTENSTTNYEINKTVERVIEGSGNITRLSVAAVINDLLVEKTVDGVTTSAYEPRSNEQIQKLEDIIKNAIGINERRQDQFSIVNLSFETKQLDSERVGEISSQPSLLDDWDKITKMLLILIAIGSSLFIVKKLMYRLKNEKILVGTVNSSALAYQGSNMGGGDMLAPPQEYEEAIDDQPKKKKRKYLPAGDLEDEISDEAVIKKMRQDKIASYVNKNPIDAAKMINAWLHEDEFN